MQDRDQKARIIQKAARKYLAWRSFYVSLCKNVKYSSTPRADGGTIPVYLPNEAPWIVIKATPYEEEALHRHRNSKILRLTLRTLNCEHIVVPKSRVFNKAPTFVVDDRVPINIDPAYNRTLYSSDPHLFDSAARNMVKLFSKTFISDLVKKDVTYKNFRYHLTNSKECMEPLFVFVRKTDGVRYDNLAFNIVKKDNKNEGVIFAVDTERLEINSTVPLVRRLAILARILPLNIDAIIEEAKKLDIDTCELELEKIIQEYSLKSNPETAEEYISSNSNKSLLVLTGERTALLVRKIQKHIIPLAFDCNIILKNKFLKELENSPNHSIEEVLNGINKDAFAMYKEKIIEAKKTSSDFLKNIIHVINHCMRKGRQHQVELRLSPELFLNREKPTSGSENSINNYLSDMRSARSSHFHKNKLIEPLIDYVCENSFFNSLPFLDVEAFVKQIVFHEIFVTLSKKEILQFEMLILKEKELCRIFW